MAARAQHNSISQTLIALMALSSDELHSGESNGTAASSPLLLPPPAPDAANATNDDGDDGGRAFRSALRAHLEELVGQQEQHFVNALGGGGGVVGGGGSNDGRFINAVANPPSPSPSISASSSSSAASPEAHQSSGKSSSSSSSNDKKQEQHAARDRLAVLLAKLAERAVTNGPATIRAFDGASSLGRAGRAAFSQQPGAGACGRYGWDAGGAFSPASWTGPTVSLSLTLGSCALVPTLEGPGAALSAGSAWTNAVGELACLGPGLAYAVSPLAYTTAGLAGEALAVPACRLGATFGPSLTLRLTRSGRLGGGGAGSGGGGGGGGGASNDTYASEGAFLAGAVLNGTLDRRLRRLQLALEAAAGIKERRGGDKGWLWGGGGGGGGGGGEGGEGDDDDDGGQAGAGGDYEIAWEVDPLDAGADDGLREPKAAKALLRGLIGLAREHIGGGGGGSFVNRVVKGASAGGFENRVVG
jgi:hypothetical protein